MLSIYQIPLYIFIYHIFIYLTEKELIILASIDDYFLYLVQTFLKPKLNLNMSLFQNKKYIKTIINLIKCYDNLHTINIDNIKIKNHNQNKNKTLYNCIYYNISNNIFKNNIFLSHIHINIPIICYKFIKNICLLKHLSCIKFPEYSTITNIKKKNIPKFYSFLNKLKYNSKIKKHPNHIIFSFEIKNQIITYKNIQEYYFNNIISF